MEFKKEQVKKATAAGLLTAGLTEYIAAAAVPPFDLLKNHKPMEFYNAFESNITSPMATISEAFSYPAFLDAQIFLLGASLAVAGKALFNKPETYEMIPEHGAYGTARWAKDHEILKNEETETHLKGEGPVIAQHKKKVISLKEDTNMNRNVLLVGGSGAGKTAGNIIDNILKPKEKSMVITDPKGELYEKTSELKRKQGYDVRLINFKDREISDRYNLFPYIRKDSDAFKIAKTLVENAAGGAGAKKTDFFEQAQTSVLQALIIYVKHALPEKQQHMASVFAIASLGRKKLKKLFYEYPEHHIVRKSYVQALENLGDPKTQDNVLITLMQTLNPWQYEDVCQFTAANDFEIADLGRKKMIVYVILPVADNEFKPLITTFFTQLFSELYLLADKHYGAIPRTCMIALDEFANIGKIPAYEERLSTTRSLNIDVITVLQDNSQLERVYGKEIAREVIANCDTRIILKANEPDTAKYFSEMVGKTTIKIKNESRSNSKQSTSKNTSYNITGRDLITKDELMRLPKDEQIVFLTGQHPMKVKKPWYFKIKQFVKLIPNKVSRTDYPVADRSDYEVFSFPEPGDFQLESIEEQEEPEIEETLLDEEQHTPPPYVDFQTREKLDDKYEEDQEEEPAEPTKEDLLKNFNI